MRSGVNVGLGMLFEGFMNHFLPLGHVVTSMASAVCLLKGCSLLPEFGLGGKVTPVKKNPSNSI